MASIHGKSLIATVAIFCCRFTGLLREICYTALFGASGAMDAFLSAFRLPNMLRDMFAEGALSQSFTSTMSKVEQQEGKTAAWCVANRVITQLSSLMIIIVALGVLLTGVLMQTLYPKKALAHFSPAASLSVFSDASEDTRIEYMGQGQDKDGQDVLHFRYQSENHAAATLSESAQPYWINVESFNNKQVRIGSQLVLLDGSLYKPDSSGLVKIVTMEESNYIELAIQLSRIMWPFILLASVSALCMGTLNVFGIFGLPNLSSAAFNIVIIAVGALLGWMIDPNYGPRALYGFAIAVVVGGLAQVLIQLPKMYKLGFRPRLDLGLRRIEGKLRFADPYVKKVWLLMIPGALAAGITQFNIFINTSFALYLPSGAVTALTMAFHLWQLPVALFGVAVGMVVLPLISRLVQQGDRDEISYQLAIALRFVAFFAIPSAIFLFIWGEEIVSVFFQRGRFDADSSMLTGQVLAAYSLGLFSYAGMKVLQPVFLALEKPWAPAFLSLGTCAVSIAMNFLFVRVLGFGAASLAFTTAFVTTLNFVFYFLFLRKIIGSISMGVLVPGLLRISAAAFCLGVQCWVLEYYFMQDFTSWGFLARLGTLALFGSVVGAIYLGMCYLFEVPELHMLLNRFRKKAVASGGTDEDNNSPAAE